MLVRTFFPGKKPPESTHPAGHLAAKKAAGLVPDAAHGQDVAPQGNLARDRCVAAHGAVLVAAKQKGKLGISWNDIVNRYSRL